MYHFKGEINYLGHDWSFVPQILINNTFESALDKRIVFLSDKTLSVSYIPIYILIGKIYDTFIFIFIAVSIAYLILKFFKKYSINNEILGTIIFFLLFFFSKNFLNFVLTNGHQLWPLCLACICFTILISFDNFIKKITFLNNLYEHPIKYLTIVITPTFFYFGKNYFGIDLENTSFWSAGDDWLVFQEYSREIVVNGKWIVGGRINFLFSTRY